MPQAAVGLEQNLVAWGCLLCEARATPDKMIAWILCARECASGPYQCSDPLTPAAAPRSTILVLRAAHVEALHLLRWGGRQLKIPVCGGFLGGDVKIHCPRVRFGLFRFGLGSNSKSSSAG